MIPSLPQPALVPPSPPRSGVHEKASDAEPTPFETFLTSSDGENLAGAEYEEAKGQLAFQPADEVSILADVDRTSTVETPENVAVETGVKPTLIDQDPNGLLTIPAVALPEDTSRQLETELTQKAGTVAPLAAFPTQNIAPGQTIAPDLRPPEPGQLRPNRSPVQEQQPTVLEQRLPVLPERKAAAQTAITESGPPHVISKSEQARVPQTAVADPISRTQVTPTDPARAAPLVPALKATPDIPLVPIAAKEPGPRLAPHVVRAVPTETPKSLPQPLQPTITNAEPESPNAKADRTPTEALWHARSQTEAAYRMTATPTVSSPQTAALSQAQTLQFSNRDPRGIIAAEISEVTIRSDSTPVATDRVTPVTHSITTAPAADQARHIAQQLATGAPTRAPGTTEINLQPEELGRVRMSLTLQDGVMMMAIQADRPETLDLMRRHIDQLAQSYRDLGFENMSFSFSNSSQQHTADLVENVDLHDAGTEADVIATAGQASLPSDGRLDLRI